MSASRPALVIACMCGIDRGEIGVSGFEPGRGAMEKLGRDGEIAFARKAIGHVADVGIHSEGFLENNQSRFRSAGRTRDIRPHGGAVGNGESHIFGLKFHIFAKLKRANPLYYPTGDTRGNEAKSFLHFVGARLFARGLFRTEIRSGQSSRRAQRGAETSSHPLPGMPPVEDPSDIYAADHAGQSEPRGARLSRPASTCPTAAAIRSTSSIRQHTRSSVISRSASSRSTWCRRGISSGSGC